MKLRYFSARAHDAERIVPVLVAAGWTVETTPDRLDADSAKSAAGCDAVCSFVCDGLSGDTFAQLAAAGVRLVTQRAVGLDNLDLDAARACGIAVAHVPGYSPHAVAEHALALMLALNRRVHEAAARTRQANFSLDGLLGFDLHGQTALIAGMGRIGEITARILLGFGCRVLAHASSWPPRRSLPGVEPVRDLHAAWGEARIISLHYSLTAATRHSVNAEMLARSRRDLVLVNTARGGVVDTAALLAALDAGRLAAYGADVIENEACVAFRDCSVSGCADPLIERLIRHPRVLLTPHQAFFTEEALADIARETARNLADFAAGRQNSNFV